MRILVNRLTAGRGLTHFHVEADPRPQELEVTDVFSQYVTLLDEIEQIPIVARQSRSLTTAQRAGVVASVVELVRERVLPQSERDRAGRQALLDDGGGMVSVAAVTDAMLGSADHDAILAPSTSWRTWIRRTSCVCSSFCTEFMRRSPATSARPS